MNTVRSQKLVFLACIFGEGLHGCMHTLAIARVQGMCKSCLPCPASHTWSCMLIFLAGTAASDDDHFASSQRAATAARAITAAPGKTSELTKLSSNNHESMHVLGKSTCTSPTKGAFTNCMCVSLPCVCQAWCMAGLGLSVCVWVWRLLLQCTSLRPQPAAAAPASTKFSHKGYSEAYMVSHQHSFPDNCRKNSGGLISSNVNWRCKIVPQQLDVILLCHALTMHWGPCHANASKQQQQQGEATEGFPTRIPCMNNSIPATCNNSMHECFTPFHISCR